MVSLADNKIRPRLQKLLRYLDKRSVNAKSPRTRDEASEVKELITKIIERKGY